MQNVEKMNIQDGPRAIANHLFNPRDPSNPENSFRRAAVKRAAELELI